MVYAASLSVPVKKALTKQAQQSTVNTISKQMGIDPDNTQMDVVILGPKDMIGPKAVKMQKAVDGKHPDICVIYLYTKADERDLLNCEYKEQVKKMDKNSITAAFEKFVGDHTVRTGKTQLQSADFEAAERSPVESKDDDYGGFGMPGDDEEVSSGRSFFSPRRKKKRGTDLNSVEQNEEVRLDFEEELIQNKVPSGDVLPEFEETDQQVNLEKETVPDAPELNIPEIDMSAFKAEPVELDTNKLNKLDITEKHAVDPISTIEEALSKVDNYEDWTIFKEHLNHDSIVKGLISENSEYHGLVNMIDVLDKRIETVWRDTALSADQKFEKIKEIGLEKSVVRASVNSIHVDKVISVISTIVLSAKRTVEEKVQSVDSALFKVSVDKQKLSDTSYIDRAIEERTKVQLDMLNISRSIVDLYKSIDTLVTDEIAELDRKLPSSNQFVNDMVKPIGTQIFTPLNTASLTNKLMRALQENSIVASQLETSVNSLISSLFELCEKDEEIIRYQQNMINMLRAQRVEDVIITNTLLKKIMRIYVAANNTGGSATAITWCGILSRRQNSLLVDLTGKSKFREYGITPMSLDDFMSSRTEKQFLCVESNRILGPDELQAVIEQLKGRLNYYPYVNVIVAPDDEVGLQYLSEEALCVHYITDCSTSSIDIMRNVIKKHTYQNIARKLVTIDAPVSPLMIADSLGIDPTITKIVTLPNIPSIRACSLRHDRPYEYSDVVRIFEEAFR